MIVFRVEGEPKGQPRPRAFARNGKARVYDPGTAEGWKSAVALAARSQRPLTPIDGPVTMRIRFLMPRPKKHCGTGRNASRLKASAPTFHTTKPDIDNLSKSVMDALTDIAVLKDDTIVVRLHAEKVYADGVPGAEIEIVDGGEAV